MKIIEDFALPKEMFGLKTSPELLAQSVRVYLANQRQGNQNAKTRSEVNRTRKKLYKQKGTGGARHGDRKSPIFVGGGVSFAPKPRNHSLNISKQMKKSAFYGALSVAAKDQKIFVVSGMEKLTGKTKELAGFIGKARNTLLVTNNYYKNILLAGRNISGLTIVPFSQLNTYEILKADKIYFMEEIFEKKDSLVEKEVKKTIKKTIKKKK